MELGGGEVEHLVRFNRYHAEQEHDRQRHTQADGSIRHPSWHSCYHDPWYERAGNGNLGNFYLQAIEKRVDVTAIAKLHQDVGILPQILVPGITN